MMIYSKHILIKSAHSKTSRSVAYVASVEDIVTVLLAVPTAGSSLAFPSILAFGGAEFILAGVGWWQCRRWRRWRRWSRRATSIGAVSRATVFCADL